MRSLLTASAAILAFSTPLLHAQVQVVTGHDEGDAGFWLGSVPPPAITDAAQKATFKVVDGQPGPTPVSVLNDGQIPAGPDDPKSNFFFADQSEGGRFSVDLGSVITIKSVDTYSWHGGGRAPQIYRLWASDGKDPAFNAAPKKGTDPATVGWKLVTTVDTVPKSGAVGGQYGVEISDKIAGSIGNYQYLLFETARTSKGDPFANTFFSEIDVIDAKAPPVERVKTTAKISKTFVSSDKKYTFIIEASKAPELMEWAEKELVPVIKTWYPKTVALLPSKGYSAPTTVTFEFKDDMKGTPAYAVGNRISLNHQWFSSQLKGEARGSVVHEMTHVVQQYGHGSNHVPGWVTEGIPDYVRWFLYEPQSHGAEITKNNIASAKYDGNYRISANFLNWVQKTKDKDLILQLNTVGREGTYSEELWKKWTGKTVQELNDDWKAACQKAIDNPPPAKK
jgi:hypothetical protein